MKNLNNLQALAKQNLFRILKILKYWAGQVAQAVRVSA
jgi:hypothetical protein